MEKGIGSEVIIVGGGPSGLACAKALSGAGIETILFERSEKNTAKSFFSGVIKENIVLEIFPNFKDKILRLENPIERKINQFTEYLIKDDSFTALKNESLSNERYFSVLWKPFIEWLTDDIKNSGVKVLNNSLVEELIVENRKIVGVISEEKEYFSNVVVLGEGANQLLTKNTGLRKGVYSPSEVFIFFEENIELKESEIEKRFNTEPGHGHAMKFFVDFKEIDETKTLGYIVPGKNFISIGLGILLSETIKNEKNIYEYLNIFKEHDFVKSFIAGGKFINHLSYILPAETKEKNDFKNGCMLIGGAGGFINTLELDLSSNAFTSGWSCGKAIVKGQELKV